VLFYRKDYLKKSGVNPENISTWDDFRLACLKIQKNTAGGPLFAAPMGFSGQKEQVILQDLACWIWPNGGDFLSGDAKHAALTQSETKQGMKFLARLISDNLISKTSIELNNGEVAENFFMHDAYAFMLSSSWPLHVYLSSSSKNYVGKPNSGNFGVMPVPAGPSGRFNFAGGSALALTSFGKNPDKAMKLLEFLTGRQSMARYCRNINMLPSRIDVPVVIGADKSTQKVFQDAISKYGRSFPVHPLWGSIEQIILNGAAHTLWDFGQSNYKQSSLFQNLSDINQEIEYMLSLFGE
jgi:multiple sugar transport system substrate-binding protein